jgi:outer membrane protein TolC
MADDVTDVSTITDLQALKALAYDAIAAKEQAEQDLRTINSRISELMNLPPADSTGTAKVSRPPHKQKP